MGFLLLMLSAAFAGWAYPFSLAPAFLCSFSAAAELRSVQNHWRDQWLDSGAADGPAAVYDSEEDASGPSVQFYSSEASQLASVPSAGSAPASAAPSLLSLSEAQPQGADEGAGSSVSCVVHFTGGYASSPVVNVEAAEPVEGKAMAVFVDESAQFWLHGLQGNVEIPSTFQFSGSDGDYADIHPPAGTGKHKYTVILYKKVTGVGSLLSSLAGTPWDNRSRALGSLEALEEQLHTEGGGKPTELCRCSVEVSHEDIEASGAATE